MPSSIPYDPSLVLGNIVSEEVIDNVEAIADAQADADAAQAYLNALLMTRRSLDMTKAELLNLGIDVQDLTDNLIEVNDNIEKAAIDYCKKKMKAEEDIVDLRSKTRVVNDSPESPVDFVKTEIKSMPLATDSINMDVQYFSLSENMVNTDEYAKQIGGFVSATTGWMGVNASTEMSTKASQQVSQQTSMHSVSGTLVLSVSCTHKNAAVLAPFILNVDKGIKVWNRLYPSEPIKPDKLSTMLNMADDKNKTKKFTILSGVTYGSSFVGMVHILNTTKTTSSQSMDSTVASLQAQMDTGGWFSKNSGGFGVNTAFSNSVKDMLSSQNVTSHVSLICMGCVPSIASNKVQIGVQTFADSDPKQNMEALAALQNATASGQETIQQAAEAARTGQQMVSMKTGEIQATLAALGTIDDGENSVLDINSMMSALEDYVGKVPDADSGVPINYYLKDITRDMLAEMWVAKYFPGEYMQIQYDDSELNVQSMTEEGEKAPPKALQLPLRVLPKQPEPETEEPKTDEPKTEQEEPEQKETAGEENEPTEEEQQ